MKLRKLTVGTAALLGLAMSTSAFAGQAQVSSSSLQVTPDQGMTNMTLSVSGPNGFNASSFSKFSTPSLSFAQGGALADGVYTWELTGATTRMETVSGLNNGRGDAARAFKNVGASQSGMFRIQNGSVFVPGNEVEGSPQPTTGSINEN